MRADLYFLRGRIAQDAGEFHAAHAFFRRAFDGYQSARDPWSSAKAALRLGDMSRQRENFPDAIRWYKRAEKIATGGSNNQVRLDALCGRAMSLRGLGRYDAALKIFDRLLGDYRKLNDRDGVAYVLWASGTTERFAGRLGDAERHLTAAIKIYERLGDPSALAFARCALGGTLRMKGQAEASRKLYARAHATFRRLGDQFGMAYASCGQSNGLRMQGRLSEAKPHMDRAERAYRRLKLFGPLGFVLWSRAQLLIERKNFVAARRALDATEAAFRRTRDDRGLVYVLLGRAELARALSIPEADRLFRRAEAAARRLRLSLERAHAKHRLGTKIEAAYRGLGISARDFSRYVSLP